MKVFSYLNLSILLLLLVLGFEYFTKEMVATGVPIETLIVLNSTIYVASGIFMIAFIGDLKKVKSETKYILYLVVLVVVALKALSLLRS